VHPGIKLHGYFMLSRMLNQSHHQWPIQWKPCRLVERRLVLGEQRELGLGGQHWRGWRPWPSN
jgi:hypothetical protein